jgi:hypothetical protein
MITSGKISEHVKMDVAVASQSIASSNVTGAYHSMKGIKKALFEFKCAAIAKTKTVVAQVMKATSAAAAGAAALTGAAATITANVLLTKGLLTANTIVDATSTVTLTATLPDGTTQAATFTCEDTSPDITVGEFASGANDTEACVNLAAAINYLLGTWILATASSATVILTAAEPGEAVITISGEDSTIVASGLEAIGYVEIDAAQLGATFTHVALKLTTDATIIVGGTLVREGFTGGNEKPGQMVAASKVL